MKTVGIALLVCGVCLEAFALLGNRAPYPVVLKLLSPEYTAAREGYRTLMREGLLVEGDEGFDTLRDAYMRMTVMLPEPPYPLDEIEGVTINRFYGGVVRGTSELEEGSLIVADFSNGETVILSYSSILLMTNGELKPVVALVNAGLLILGCVLVYFGLRILFIDLKSAREAAGLLEKRLLPSGTA